MVAFAYEDPDEQSEGDGCESCEKDITPRGIRLAREPDSRDLVVHEARQCDADGRGALHDHARFDAAILGNGFRNEGGADSPLTANTQARYGAEEHELPHVCRKRAQRRSDRINGDRRE